jgi:vacuolar-type H+-ATPase subunit C/Vma6
MNDYDYMNARVRSMSAELLDREFYERVLAVEDEKPLLEAFMGSPYAPQLDEALAVGGGIAALESALRRNIFAVFSKLRAFSPERPRRLLNVQFNQWDAANLLSVFRGKAVDAKPEEIMQGVFPAGEFDEAQLLELASETDAATVADALTTWNYRFAFELRRAVRGIEDGADLVALEFAVNAVYFRWALSELEGGQSDARTARRMIRMQIDLANVKEALDHVRHRSKGDALGDYEPLPGGQLDLGVVEGISRAGSLVEAFEIIADTYFSPAIEKGILYYGGAGSLGVMERFLEMVIIEAGCRLSRLDPLDIAVPLGFIWRKYSEFVNVRIVVRGKKYRMPVNAIREEMLIA